MVSPRCSSGHRSQRGKHDGCGEPRVLVIWLPPYCSDLNPIERFWRYLKDQACANHLEDDIACVLQQAERTMSHQNHPDAENRYHVSKNL